MAIVNLVWYQPKVRRILKDIKGLKQVDIARELGLTRSAINKAMSRNKYEKDLIEMIQILNLAGYEIREKEE
ncbi:MAG: hypothetical protein KBT27_08205 [Prevotellaceae bacterium]|nr:hypothetical protein [Candidatus Faecinaster equi]